jgi:tetratricopeptide (TPR) repeat protein
VTENPPEAASPPRGPAAATRVPYREGRRRALEDHARRPVLTRDIADLIGRLRRYNETGAIRESLARLPPLEQVNIPTLLFLASQLGLLNQPEEALRFLDEAKQGDPDYPPTLAARGQVLTWLGRFEEAGLELERCIGLAPQLAQPHWLLSRLRTWSVEEEHLDRLRTELARPGRSPKERALIGFALHKELDDLGLYGEAWDALVAACAAQRSGLEYSYRATRPMFDALMALPPLAAATPRSDDAITPVFIVGMHRSGTTLLEQLLSGHSQVQSMGELYDFTAQLRLAADHHCRGALDGLIVEQAADFDYTAIGRGYLDGIGWRSRGRRFCVDKLPSNFLNLPFIFAALPRARVLHMVRDPVETCFSNLRELFADACPYSYDQEDLAGYFRLYRRLMEHWGVKFAGRFLDVSYEALVSDTGPTLRRVTDYLGVPFEPAMLDPAARAKAVATASAVQVREVVAPRASARWKPYVAQLQPLLEGIVRQDAATYS